MNKIQNTQLVGIDLGTTNTSLAIWDETGKPVVIPNLQGEVKTPSVVYVGKGGQEILVGDAALNMQMLEPTRTLEEFKREVGTDKVYFTEGGIAVTPEWCQTQMLKYMRESAVKHTGDALAASKACISVPAYYKEQQRQSVMGSAKAAGIEVIELTNEPTCAGLAFGIAQKQGDLTTAILDFGGGTFDVSIVRYENNEATVFGSHGALHCGGKDVDTALLGLALEQLKREHNIVVSKDTHAADWFALLQEVRRAKHLLAVRTEVKISARVDGKSSAVTVNRKKFESVCSPTMKTAEKVIMEAIESAKVDRKEIKRAVLVGGSSRIVWFQDMAKRIFGEDAIVPGQCNPDLAIAEGAAIAAARRVSSAGKEIVNEAHQAIPKPNIKHTDCMPHSLGVAALNGNGSEPKCSVILERNTIIPCEAVDSYGSVEESQTVFHIQVLQGEEGQPVKDCLVVGEKHCHFPPRSADKPTIEVKMGYDPSGMAKILVTDLISKRTEDITVNFAAVVRK